MKLFVLFALVAITQASALANVSCGFAVSSKIDPEMMAGGMHSWKPGDVGEFSFRFNNQDRYTYSLATWINHSQTEIPQAQVYVVKFNKGTNEVVNFSVETKKFDIGTIQTFEDLEFKYQVSCIHQ